MRSGYIQVSTSEVCEIGMGHIYVEAEPCAGVESGALTFFRLLHTIVTGEAHRQVDM